MIRAGLLDLRTNVPRQHSTPRPYCSQGIHTIFEMLIKMLIKIGAAASPGAVQ